MLKSENQIFRKRCEKIAENLSRQVMRMPWDNKSFYAAWLAQTYYFVSHSTRLLALAAARFHIDQDETHQRFISHMSEEKRHERLCLHDLKAIGVELNEIPEMAQTKAFYQRQYYLIEHVCPESFFGYILCLELLAVMVGKNAHDVVKRAHGEKSGSFLGVHSADDIEHIEQAFNSISHLPNEILTTITENLESSCQIYAAMCAQIVQSQQVSDNQTQAA